MLTSWWITSQHDTNLDPSLADHAAVLTPHLLLCGIGGVHSLKLKHLPPPLGRGAHHPVIPVKPQCTRMSVVLTTATKHPDVATEFLDL